MFMKCQLDISWFSTVWMVLEFFFIRINLASTLATCLLSLLPSIDNAASLPYEIKMHM